jgi:hypothetical protein
METKRGGLNMSNNCSDCKFYQVYIHDGRYGFGIYDSCRISKQLLEEGVCEDFLINNEVLSDE